MRNALFNVYFECLQQLQLGQFIGFLVLFWSYVFFCTFPQIFCFRPVGLMWGWLGNRVVSMLDSGAVGPGFKSQPRRCRVTVLGKLFTPIVPVLTKQQNW